MAINCEFIASTHHNRKRFPNRASSFPNEALIRAYNRTLSLLKAQALSDREKHTSWSGVGAL
jgi:hypothetical protein